MYDSQWKRRFRQRLKRWFGRHARSLPWRGTRDPYAIWVSEIMLQQTQVATVIPYYERFLDRFPTLDCLAAAEEREVLRFWEGLGYYRRARQMHRAARMVVSEMNGRFPTDPVELQRLPGIGKYTAHAILSISADRRLPILEANTIRLYLRLLASREAAQRSATQTALWEFAEQLLPQKDCGDFNQALMELGSSVCRPRDPACDACPVESLCPTRAGNLQDEIPVAAKRVEYEEVREAAVILRRRGRVLIRQCEADERWAGLWDFPRFSLPPDADPGRTESPSNSTITRHLCEQTERITGLQIEPGERLTVIRHGVTRFRITLTCYEATVVFGRTRRGLRWVAPSELSGFPLSVTGRKISDLLQS